METFSPTSALGQQVTLSHIPVQPEQSSRGQKVHRGTFGRRATEKKKQKERK